jgi:GNAT superfamily N-acetyltransferase
MVYRSVQYLYRTFHRRRGAAMTPLSPSGAGGVGGTRGDGSGGGVAGDADVRVELYDGPRRDLRPLFELAEDSAAQLDAYLDQGRVLVAVAPGSGAVGHLQLADTARPGRAELKSMAVREDVQGRGIGRRLVEAAVDLLTGESATLLLVSTAAADTGNLRFYQRTGFRMRSVERDAFTPATGYPDPVWIDGIELRDRVWLDRPLGGAR